MSQEFDWIRRMEAEIRWADETVKNLLGETFFGDALWVPRVDILETSESVIVKICAAGVKPENIDIQLSSDGRHLNIRGVREEDEQLRQHALRYYQIEIYTGPFERTINLPSDLRYDHEKISAVARGGFFIVNLPKLSQDNDTPRSVPVVSE